MHFRISMAVLAIVAVMFGASSSVRAQYYVNYVSSSGSDNNNCGSPYRVSTTTTLGPCASLAGAVSAAVDGGVIVCVDTLTSAVSVIITKAITIDCAGGGGGPAPFYVKINAPNKNVVLRNLAFNTGTYPISPVIDIVAAATVVIENVSESGSLTGGISDKRAGPGKLLLRNVTVTGNAGPGIVIAPASGTIAATLENVTSTNSAYGLAVGVGGRVLAKGSTFSGNSTTGVHADAGAIIEIEDSLLAMNPTGINANAGSTVSISNSRINSNNRGITGNTTSYGNNKFFANAASDGTTPTPASLR